MQKFIKCVNGYFNAEDVSCITYERVIDEMRNGTYEIRVNLKSGTNVVMGWYDTKEEVETQLNDIIELIFK